MKRPGYAFQAEAGVAAGDGAQRLDLSGGRT